MDFSPYQALTPERERALSPPPPTSRALSPPASSRASRALSPQARPTQQQAYAPLMSPAAAPPPRNDLDEFSTRLGLRLDVEAALAYLLLPPAGPVLLLLVETRSDYVRFHAWQSSLLFAGVFVLHLLLAWSRVLSWGLLVLDLGAIGGLAWRAYVDAPTLDRFELPFVGPLASSILDDE